MKVSNAKSDPHAHRQSLAAREGMGLHDRAKAIRGAARLGRVRVREEDHELLARRAGHAIGAARESLQELPEIRQHLVPDGLPRAGNSVTTPAGVTLRTEWLP